MGKPLPQPKEKNPRGIPKAHFIEKVSDYADNLDEATTLLGQLQELIQKYKFMEMATTSRLKVLMDRTPSLKQTVEAIEYLQVQEKPFDTQYALNEAVYAKAEIAPPKTVWLWLGASVMLEFPLDEAHELISKKLKDAEEGAKACEEDFEYLRENMTIMEVNTARVINWQVAQRKLQGVSS